MEELIAGLKVIIQTTISLLRLFGSVLAVTNQSNKNKALNSGTESLAEFLSLIERLAQYPKKETLTMTPERIGKENGSRRTGRNKADNGSKWIRPEKRWAIYDRDGHRCVYCGISMEEAASGFTLDHLVPTELGGTNESSNLLTACKCCNSSKGKKTTAAFLTWLEKTKGLDKKEVARNIRNAVRRAIKK